jgi:hypothetical protein
VQVRCGRGGRGLLRRNGGPPPAPRTLRPQPGCACVCVPPCRRVCVCVWAHTHAGEVRALWPNGTQVRQQAAGRPLTAPPFCAALCSSVQPYTPARSPAARNSPATTSAGLPDCPATRRTHLMPARSPPSPAVTPPRAVRPCLCLAWPLVPSSSPPPITGQLQRLLSRLAAHDTCPPSTLPPHVTHPNRPTTTPARAAASNSTTPHGPAHSSRCTTHVRRPFVCVPDP